MISVGISLRERERNVHFDLRTRCGNSRITLTGGGTQQNACLRTRDKARPVRGEIRHEVGYILCGSCAIHRRPRNQLRASWINFTSYRAIPGNTHKRKRIRAKNCCHLVGCLKKKNRIFFYVGENLSRKTDSCQSSLRREHTH